MHRSLKLVAGSVRSLLFSSALSCSPVSKKNEISHPADGSRKTEEGNHHVGVATRVYIKREHVFKMLMINTKDFRRLNLRQKEAIKKLADALLWRIGNIVLC